jgi:cell division septation protein DedD
MKKQFANLLIIAMVSLPLGVISSYFYIQQYGNPLRPPILQNIGAMATDSTDIEDISLNPNEPSTKKTVQPSAVNLSPIEPVTTVADEYLVITGVFKSQENADKEIKRLKGMGYKTAYSYPSPSNPKLKIVCAGKFADSKARNAAKSLKDKGVDAFVDSAKGK